MDDMAIELDALDLERVCSDASKEPINLTYRLLRFVTKDFSNEIGRGGFGVVYMGTMQNGRVAVKKLSNLHALPDKKFLDEILCLKKAKHKNIVRLLGYCSETHGELLEFNGANVMAEVQKRLLCFEYVPNGNLHHYLEEKPKGGEWKICYQIIKGICHGLQYLHEERIGHLDLKPENVMLDACTEPKITDFGLSRCLVKGQSKVYTTTIRGTPGFIAPEVINTGKISLKSDIYALGIIIIRLLTGCNNFDLDKWNLCPDVLLYMDNQQVRCCANIADMCKSTNQDHRPTIGFIIRMLDETESMLLQSTNDIGSSTNQVSPMVYPSTELLDVHPLELSFPFKTKQQHESRCQVSLINKTDGEVGFFVIPNLVGRIMPINGILMPMSTSVITLKMLFSRKGEPQLGSSDKVLILMCVMSSSDDVGRLIKMSVDKDGELNMPTDDLYKQVQQSGGKIHGTTLNAAAQNDTRNHSAEFLCSTRVFRSNRIKSVDVHPTEPWILVLSADVYIWNWQTKQEINIKIRYPSSVKFIARKQWLVIGTDQSIYVYKCPTLKKIKKVKQFRFLDSESSYSYTKLAVHPSHPFAISYGQDTHSYGQDTRSVASMKLWNWDQNWSCTRIFDVTSLVLQVINTKDTNTFATLDEHDGVNSVKIWNFGCSTPIATMPQELEGTKIAKNFTSGADQHLTAAIRGSCVMIWDLHKRERVHRLSIHRDRDSSDRIVAVVCHPKYPVLVTGSYYGFIHVWDCNTYRLKKEYERDYFGLLDLAFLESGRLVVTCDLEVGIMDIDVN